MWVLNLWSGENKVISKKKSLFQYWKCWKACPGSFICLAKWMMRRKKLWSLNFIINFHYSSVFCWSAIYCKTSAAQNPMESPNIFHICMDMYMRIIMKYAVMYLHWHEVCELSGRVSFVKKEIFVKPLISYTLPKYGFELT